MILIDGVVLDIHINGQRIKRAARFKYLGVFIDEFGSSKVHIEEKTLAFNRTTGMLLASLRRISAYSFELMRFLWTTFVTPIA